MSTSSSDQPHFAYLLLSHNNPRQVEALARRILDLSPHAQIVVHHDSRAADPPWGGRPSAPIHLVERGRVSWGDWSMIEATLRMLRYAVDQLDADWFVLVSGEHRPAVDLRQWEMTAAESGNDALLGAVRLPAHLRFGTSDFELNQYLARSRHRWRLVSRPRRNAVHRAMGLLMKISTRIRPIMSVEYIHRRDAWAVGSVARLAPGARLALLPRLAVVRAEPAGSEGCPRDRSGRRPVVRAELDPRRGVPADGAASGTRAHNRGRTDNVRARHAGGALSRLEAALAPRRSRRLGLGTSVRAKGRPRRTPGGRREYRRGRGRAAGRRAKPHDSRDLSGAATPAWGADMIRPGLVYTLPSRGHCRRACRS